MKRKFRHFAPLPEVSTSGHGSFRLAPSQLPTTQIEALDADFGLEA
jgi:hypothetical protein